MKIHLSNTNIAIGVGAVAVFFWYRSKKAQQAAQLAARTRAIAAQRKQAQDAQVAQAHRAPLELMIEAMASRPGVSRMPGVSQNMVGPNAAPMLGMPFNLR